MSDYIKPAFPSDKEKLLTMAESLHFENHNIRALMEMQNKQVQELEKAWEADKNQLKIMEEQLNDFSTRLEVAAERLDDKLAVKAQEILHLKEQLGAEVDKVRELSIALESSNILLEEAKEEVDTRVRVRTKDSWAVVVVSTLRAEHYLRDVCIVSASENIRRIYRKHSRVVNEALQLPREMQKADGRYRWSGKVSEVEDVHKVFLFDGDWEEEKP